MNRKMIAVLLALGLILPSLVKAQEEVDLDMDVPELPDFSMQDSELQMEMEELPEGDHKTFTITTDEDISTVRPEDIYKSNGTFFKVAGVNAKGAKGGKFFVERYRGEAEAGLRLNRVSGEGPLTIQARHTVLDRFRSGGVVMYPVAFLLLTVIIVTIQCAIRYRKSLHCHPRFVEECRQAIGSGNLNQFQEISLKQKGLLAQACRAIMINFSKSTLEDCESRSKASAGRAIDRLRFPLRLLNFISVVAPLLGLLGTVVGMITCFDSLGEQAASASKAALMASGIKVALLTTAFGLIVAVPALFIYFAFNSKLSGVIADCEQAAEEFLHMIGNLLRHASPAIVPLQAAPQPAGVAIPQPLQPIQQPQPVPSMAQQAAQPVQPQAAPIQPVQPLQPQPIPAVGHPAVQPVQQQAAPVLPQPPATPPVYVTPPAPADGGGEVRP
jgi:biopolymer transport protein ExbB